MCSHLQSGPKSVRFYCLLVDLPLNILSYFFAKKYYCISVNWSPPNLLKLAETGKVLFVKVERGRSLCEARCSTFHSPVCWAPAFLLQFCIFIFMNRTIFSCRFPFVSSNIGLFSHYFSGDLVIKISQSSKRFVWFCLVSVILVSHVVNDRWRTVLRSAQNKFSTVRSKIWISWMKNSQVK